MRLIALAGLAGVFAAMLALERLFPLRRRTRPTAGRWLVNLAMTALAFAAGALIVRPAAVYVLGRADAGGFGLLHWLPLPLAGQLVAGVLLMDLSFYWWHRVNHGSGLLWRFHSVHHVDPDMDVTTSNRFHVVEIGYSAAFRAVQVAVLGVPLLTYAAYEVIFQAATMFHHSNLRLPVRLERAIGFVFVTPRMHGVHHSVVREEVNANYSTVFHWWDALHRTLIRNVPQQAVRIGVVGYLSDRDNRLRRLLTMPFARRKDRGPSPSRPESERVGPRGRIAE